MIDLFKLDLLFIGLFRRKNFQIGSNDGGPDYQEVMVLDIGLRSILKHSSMCHAVVAMCFC